MLDLIKFKIYRFAFNILCISVRVGLRIIYGKKRRDELILQGRFPFYHRLNQKQYSMRWSAPKYGNDDWEPKVSNLLKNIKGELFIDIGASVGYYTLLLASNFDEVIAIEPEPKSANKLRQNTEHLKNVRVIEEAVSNEDGETTLYVSSTIGWHTITPQNSEPYEPTKIRTRTLKTILGGRTASLVKVDTEGAELKILDGAPANKVRAWLIETHGGEPRKRELETRLIRDGYEINWVTDTHIFGYPGPTGNRKRLGYL